VQTNAPQRTAVKSVEVATPALQPHEIEREKKRQLLAKVKTLRENWVLNLGRIDGDPKKAYVWVNQHESRVIWYEGLQFAISRSVVEVKDGRPQVVSGVKTNYVREDGTHRRGDLILMECDREFKEALDAEGELRAVEQLEGAKQSFEAFADRERVPYNR